MKKFILFIFLFIFFVNLKAFAINKKDKIYIYNDESVSIESLEQTIYSFKTLVKNYKLITINSS